MHASPQHLILWPMITLAAITFCVAVRMFTARIGELHSRKIPAQAVATSRGAVETYQATEAADNFKNLFELPVLFYALCTTLLVMEMVTPAQLALAWSFVISRGAHSAIHLSYNRVVHRFAAHLAGMACLATMWVLFAIGMWPAAQG